MRNYSSRRWDRKASSLTIFFFYEMGTLQTPHGNFNCLPIVGKIRDKLATIQSSAFVRERFRFMCILRVFIVVE